MKETPQKAREKIVSGTLGLNKFSASEFDNSDLFDSQVAASQLYQSYKDASSSEVQERGVKRKRILGYEDILQDKRLKVFHSRKILLPKRLQRNGNALVTKHEPVASTSKQEPVASGSYGADERMETDDYESHRFRNVREMKSLHEEMEIDDIVEINVPHYIPAVPFDVPAVLHNVPTGRLDVTTVPRYAPVVPLNIPTVPSDVPEVPPNIPTVPNNVHEVPINVPVLVPVRKRRAPPIHPIRDFEPAAKKMKTSHCEGPCPCKSGGTLLSIAETPRYGPIIQPLYTKLLQSRLLRGANVVAFHCCENDCSARWRHSRIPAAYLLDEYDPSDLHATEFEWGNGKPKVRGLLKQ